jgi:hypothetical protein
MSLKRDLNTGLILRRSTGGLMCNTCCFIPTFANCYVGAYTDPSPSDYSSDKEYALYECVSYDGFTWYSTGAGNKNHTPEEYVTPQYWAKYIACGNTDWDSISPFGGINGAPQLYAIAFHIVKRPDPAIYLYGGGVLALYSPPYGDSEYCRIGTYGYRNGGSVKYDYHNHGESYYDQDGEAELFLYNALFNSFTIYLFIGMYIATAPTCTLKGTATNYYNLYDGTCSWRPLDCNYTMWRATLDYSNGACVTHNGKFWKCCNYNGPGTSHGVQEPAGTSTVCTGSNYWRLVV